MTTAELHRLVLRAQAQDSAALDELLARCEPAFRRMARRACPSADVDDAVQEVLVQVSEQVGSVRVAAAFFSWAMRSLVRRCLAYQRRASRFLFGTDAPQTTAPESISDDGLKEALLALSDTSRAVLLNRDILGYTARETAELLDMSVESVKSRLRRAREQLRSALSDAAPS